MRIFVICLSVVEMFILYQLGVAGWDIDSLIQVFLFFAAVATIILALFKTIFFKPIYYLAIIGQLLFPYWYLLLAEMFLAECKSECLTPNEYYVTYSVVAVSAILSLLALYAFVNRRKWATAAK